MVRLKGAPKSRNPSISLPFETYERVKKYAASQGVSMSAVVEAFLSEVGKDLVEKED